MSIQQRVVLKKGVPAVLTQPEPFFVWKNNSNYLIYNYPG